MTRQMVGRSQMEDAEILSLKTKGATDRSVAPRLVPSPRYFAKFNYCNCNQLGGVTQTTFVIPGAALNDAL